MWTHFWAILLCRLTSWFENAPPPKCLLMFPNSIHIRYLGFALEGRLRLHLKPPAFNQEHWKDHEDLAKIKEVVHTTLNSVPLEEDLLEEEDDEYSEEDEIENQAIASCSNKFKLLHSDE